MIRKLRIRFVALAMSALFIFLLLIALGINSLNYRSVAWETDRVMAVLSQNQGAFPDEEDLREDGTPLPPNMSPEIPFESRYFSVLFDSDDEVVSVDTARIYSVDEADAEAYGEQALSRRSDSGFLDAFRYVRITEADGTRVVFLDCGRKLEQYRRSLWISIAMLFGGLLIAFVPIYLISGRIVRPVAESYDKQKRFITDAGHEIKTPLAIINANADVLDLELGEGNECVDEIRSQTRRLASLTNDLVALSRMEEAERTLPKTDFSLSEAVRETAEPFAALAKTGGKTFTCTVEPDVTMHGDAQAIRRLVSILTDNAMKYSPEGGEVSLTLERQGRTVRLRVFNTTAAPIDRGELERVFDRFYRMDASRNSETGGHGIGLSMAKAIVAAHDGRITAASADGHSFCVTAVFPR